jgi:small subunit ribosomal protein S11
MGKKRVVQKTTEEILKEGEKIEKQFQFEIKKQPSLPLKEGKIYISSTYNNTILTLTDTNGNLIFWTSAGRVGFKNTKKGTPYAASKAAEVMAEVVKKLKIDKIQVLIKGVGAGRESALRSLAAKDLNIISIKDVTPIPHDGCRPPKVRRV